LHDTNDSTPIRIHKIIRVLYESLAKTTIAYPELKDYLIADFKHIKRKQKYLITCGVANPAKHEGLSKFIGILGE